LLDKWGGLLLKRFLCKGTSKKSVY